MNGYTQKEKKKFRDSKEWKDFRADKIDKVNGCCECCGIDHSKHTRKLQVHHKDSDKKNYSNLSKPENFAVLCSVCHKILHQLEARVRSKKQATKNRHIIDLVAGYFLGITETAGDRVSCEACGGVGRVTANR